MPLPPSIEGIFPNLDPNQYIVTSPETPFYNCLAWAAGDTTRWWSPTVGPRYYWPPSAPREPTVASAKAAFEVLGYEECETADYELDFEKVAIFVDEVATLTHASRQLPTGNWTSKLGELQDIEHEHLGALTGTDPAYGTVALIMRRPWPTQP